MEPSSPIDASISKAGVERIGLLTVLLAALTAVGILFLWVAYLPANPLTPPWSVSQEIAFKQIVPQGWGFFTKSQRDEFFTVYRSPDGKTWTESPIGPQSEPREWFGLLRASRAEGIEFGRLTSDLSAGSYLTCDDSLPECFKHLPLMRIVLNTYSHPFLCGRALFVWQKPIPWSWAGFNHVTQSSRIANLEILCK